MLEAAACTPKARLVSFGINSRVNSDVYYYYYYYFGLKFWRMVFPDFFEEKVEEK